MSLRDDIAGVLDYHCETRQDAEAAADAVMAIIGRKDDNEALRVAVAQAMAAIEELQRLSDAAPGTSLHSVQLPPPRWQDKP